MHRKLVKIARVALDILADRQTDSQTDRRGHHNTSPALPQAK